MPDFCKGTYCTPDMFDGSEAYVLSYIPSSSPVHHCGYARTPPSNVCVWLHALTSQRHQEEGSLLCWLPRRHLYPGRARAESPLGVEGEILQSRRGGLLLGIQGARHCACQQGYRGAGGMPPFVCHFANLSLISCSISAPFVSNRGSLLIVQVCSCRRCRQDLPAARPLALPG